MEEFLDYSDIENNDDSDEPVIQHRAPQLPPAPRFASFAMNNKHLLESSESNMITAVNEILSTNSRNLPVCSELMSLAEKDTSNVSSQEILTTGTTRERHSQRNSGVLDAHDLSSHETPSTSFMNITPAGRRSQPNINGISSTASKDQFSPNWKH
ncbi:uncharacterized protein LOC124436710 [Xenia sp. Carnegie-2017]|uniref:uncharacterized protein LOC124436710 n=1 Tax=Xenia sp. Carnegie-2017 TaxID=2897299 RepID=UPI001F04243B|nr:uncharacterized protein LOC124436710 [Xenia sp. Carnegie-2017]XP_046842636.1 uncharacterized protein LOC124436710 [Xenia sp. Carnegie-2017]